MRVSSSIDSVRFYAKPRKKKRVRKKGGQFVDDLKEIVDGWVLCSRFDSFEKAGTVYEEGKSLVFANDLDASVYRIILAGTAYAVAIGFSEPPALLKKELIDTWARGMDTELPIAVVATLALRHSECEALGVKFERRGNTPITKIE